MKGLSDISKAFSWFILCVAAALFLLVAALIYSGVSVFRRSTVGKKIVFPKFQLAR